MNKLCFWALCLTQAWLCSSTAWASKKSNLTLNDVLKSAIEHSPLIAKAQKEQLFAKAEEEKAKSLFWPKLRLESTHGVRNQAPNPLSPSEYSFSSLSLRQNIWNEGLDAKKVALARAQRRQAELKYFQQRDELCLNIAQEFYRYSQLVKSLEIMRNQHRLLKRQFELISDEYLQGLRSRRDFLRFKSQAQRAELDLQAQITQVEKARLTFMALAGFGDLSPQHQFQPEDSPPPLLDLFKNPAELSNTYEIQMLNLNEEISNLSRQISVKQIDPVINLDLKTSLTGSDYWQTGKTFEDQESRSWSAFLTFNWTIWDGGENRSRETQAYLQNEIAVADIRQKRIRLESEIRKLQTEFLQLKQNFKTSEEFLVLEQNNFLFLEGEYRQSKTTYLDYINGVKDLAEAQNRHWRNLFDLKQGLILYHYYKGSLLRFLLNDYATEAENANSEES